MPVLKVDQSPRLILILFGEGRGISQAGIKPRFHGYPVPFLVIIILYQPSCPTHLKSVGLLNLLHYASRTKIINSYLFPWLLAYCLRRNLLQDQRFGALSTQNGVCATRVGDNLLWTWSPTSCCSTPTSGCCTQTNTGWVIHNNIRI